MKILIHCTLILLLTQIAFASQMLYEINLNYDNQKITLRDISISYGNIPQKVSNPRGRHNATLYSFLDKELDSYNFIIENEIIAEGVDSQGKMTGKKIEIENLNFTIFIPYFSNGNTISIFDRAKNKLLDIDVSKLAQCNENSFCDETEDMNTCPDECFSKSRPILIPTGEATKETKNSIDYAWILPAFLLIILASVFSAYLKKSKMRRN